MIVSRAEQPYRVLCAASAGDPHALEAVRAVMAWRHGMGARARVECTRLGEALESAAPPHLVVSVPGPGTTGARAAAAVLRACSASVLLLNGPLEIRRVLAVGSGARGDAVSTWPLAIASRFGAEVTLAYPLTRSRWWAMAAEAGLQGVGALTRADEERRAERQAQGFVAEAERVGVRARCVLLDRSGPAGIAAAAAAAGADLVIVEEGSGIWRARRVVELLRRGSTWSLLVLRHPTRSQRGTSGAARTRVHRSTCSERRLASRGGPARLPQPATGATQDASPPVRMRRP